MAAPHVAQVVPDPMIERGPFKVFTRTDGVAIVVDTRRPLGRKTVFECATLKEATLEAEHLAKHAPK